MMPPPNMKALIQTIDTDSKLLETLYQNDSVNFNNIRKRLFFMMLSKNYFIGFSILILIDLYGRATLEKDEEIICYDNCAEESLMSSIAEEIEETKVTKEDSISDAQMLNCLNIERS